MKILLVGLFCGILLTGSLAYFTQPKNDIAYAQTEITRPNQYLGQSFFIARITGDSMQPWIFSGQTGLGTAYVFELLKVGDVITFDRPDTILKSDYVTHVVVLVGKDDEGNYVRTKGINNLTSDPWLVRPGDLTGIIIGVLW